jgi:hypothetical protein
VVLRRDRIGVRVGRVGQVYRGPGVVGRRAGGSRAGVTRVEVTDGLGPGLDRDHDVDRTSGGIGQGGADLVAAVAVEPLACERVRARQHDRVVAEADRVRGGQPLALCGRGHRPHHVVEARGPQGLQIERRWS